MADTGRMAVFHGTGKPFEIREYPVPDPQPGAALIKISLANVCGSDLHYWRGEQDYARMGRPLPLNTGHEHVGTIAKLGDGVTTDAAGRPLAVRGALADVARVVRCAGPWRTSGEWWDADRWSREEWDVALDDTAVVRLLHDPVHDRWLFEGAYD